VAEDMDVLPHQLMHYLGLGMEDRVLGSKTIWMCAGCFTCAVRCPNDIDITTVMDELRAKAVARGVPCPKSDVLTFHRTFIRDIKRRGRVHELRLMGEYNLMSGKPFNNMKLAPHMLLRRRLHLLPPRPLRGFRRWVRRLLRQS